MSYWRAKARREAALAELADCQADGLEGLCAVELGSRTLRLTLDAASVADAKAALSGLDVNRYPERRERIEVFLQGVESVDQLLRVEIDPDATVGADDCRMLLKLSDGLRDFLSAFRAGEGRADV